MIRPVRTYSKTRDLIDAVMRATATRREVRSYLRSDFETKKVSIFRLNIDIQNGPQIAKALGHIKELGTHPLVVLDAAQLRKRYISDEISFSQCLSTLAKVSQDFSGLLSDERAQPVSPFNHSSDKQLSINGDQLTFSLESGIPVICPLACDLDTMEMKLVGVHDILKCLARFLGSCDTYEVDKVVLIDKLGGIPSLGRSHQGLVRSHVLINMQQEFDNLYAEIKGHPGLEEDEKVSHIDNLVTIKEILGHLPSRATGIITTPESAGAVSERNPIIYNILTDRPLISPSLPVNLSRTHLNTSIIRRGLPVKVHFSKKGVSLARLARIGELDIPKLLNLINHSFGRTLDLKHYLDRIQSRVAAVIIVGDYDGVAIITYEKGKSGKSYAYLDKFAVHPASQGSLGVADVLMIHMVRRLFPAGVLWRSRKSNPVNKWYFERATGSLKIVDTQWELFWAAPPEVPPLEDYIHICTSIEPSLRESH